MRTLSLKDLLRLDEELHDLIAAQQNAPGKKKKSKREVVPGSTRKAGEWTYRLEYVKCGKERCKNDRHGPYWYGYRASGGRTISKYFGKKLPKAQGKQPASAKKTRTASKRA